MTVLVVAGLVGWDHWAAVDSGTASPASAVTGRPMVGRPAPELTATLVTGQPVSLSALRGHPVWLTFGATWCAECRVEAPDLAEQAARWRPDGLVVLALYLERDPADVRDFATRLHLEYLHATDPEHRIAARYRVVGLPTHYFIDADGIVRAAAVGVLTPQEMTLRVQQILPGATS
ncbi:MAG: TlpA disulfide reductase family protein [Kineosporiaceae bacterium]